jgi:hypothetical protein
MSPWSQRQPDARLPSERNDRKRVHFSPLAHPTAMPASGLFGPFAKPSGNDRFLRIAAVHLNIVQSPQRAGNLRGLVREVRYNVNLETRDEYVVWIGEHGPYCHHIG